MTAAQFDELLGLTKPIASSEEAEQSDYLKFRGKCKELSEEACRKDSTLTLVRGHYFCPFWNTEEPHWWTIRGRWEHSF